MKILNWVKTLSASVLLAVLVFSQTGCGIILVGTAAGAYIYGKNLKKCQSCEKMMNKEEQVCPHCGKEVSVE